MTYNQGFLILLAVLQVADALLTICVFRAGGYERNKLLVKLDERIGKEASVLVAKAIFLLLIVWCYQTSLPSFMTPILGAFCGLYVWVCQNNWRALKKQREINAAKAQNG